MTTITTNEAKPAAPQTPTVDWARITMALDQRAAALGGGLPHYLRDDLSELVPRAQPMFYVNGTSYDAEKVKRSFDALAARFQNAMHGDPLADDKQLFQRGRAPLYAAFLQAEYPENKQVVLEALKRQMSEAASAYSQYAERMMQDSFPRGSVPAAPATTRELSAAIEQPLLRAYCCMEMLRPSAGETVMGLTDNRMAVMQAFEFMKEIADAEIRTQLAKAPKQAPKTAVHTHTVQNPAPSLFGERARTSEADLARMRAEAETKKATAAPEKKGWFSR